MRGTVSLQSKRQRNRRTILIKTCSKSDAKPIGHTARARCCILLFHPVYFTWARLNLKKETSSSPKVPIGNYVCSPICPAANNSANTQQKAGDRLQTTTSVIYRKRGGRHALQNKILKVNSVSMAPRYHSARSVTITSEIYVTHTQSLPRRHSRSKWRIRENASLPFATSTAAEEGGEGWGEGERISLCGIKF